jgi:chemosensory pili system protein ChpC
VATRGDKQKKVDEELEPVRCLVIPADPGFLVIPSAAVAEVVPLAIEETAGEDDLLGHMNWRGLKIPVYSIEGLAGDAIPEFGKRSKACIFYPWKGSATDKFFAIATMHDPRPRLISGNDISSSGDDRAENAYIKASFLFDGESAVIPDLEAISRKFA